MLYFNGHTYILFQQLSRDKLTVQMQDQGPGPTGNCDLILTDLSYVEACKRLLLSDSPGFGPRHGLLRQIQS